MTCSPSLEVASLARIRNRCLRRLRPDVIDVPRLRNLRTRSCTPSICKGMCCAAGAGLLPEEADLLIGITRDHLAELLRLGLTQAPGVGTEGNPRTTVTKCQDDQAACSWLLPDGRCSLQVLATLHGLDPWAYKPIACILFPLRVQGYAGLRVLTSDRRTLARCLEAPRCATFDAEVTPLSGLSSEAAFVADIWGHDISTATQTSIPSVHDLSVIGLAARTNKSEIWACQTTGHGTIAVKATIGPGNPADIEREQTALTRLNKLGYQCFPTLITTWHLRDERSALVTKFLSKHRSLALWLKECPSHQAITTVVRKLLESCISLEKAGTFHSDFCMRNILIEPDSLQVVICDLEHSYDDSESIYCQGGAYGYAAPEQYLNYLGQHSHLTESFFVGAFLHHAFHPKDYQAGPAFDFSIPTTSVMPENLQTVMWALVGDPAMGYDAATRLSASEVLLQWDESSLPPGYSAPSPILNCITERILVAPSGLTLHIHQKGVDLWCGQSLLSYWPGLVDVTCTPMTWDYETLNLGGATVDNNGIHLRTL